ncbi:T9SS type A sorting domain-containing protein [candidate division WOR-3 bacterium]|nr:T9SS type A sorting domain-containing protein [candidate division WOR-3 bacterium]
MISYLLIASLFCSFNMKWYLPQGVGGSNEWLLVMDTDRDSHWELMFTTYDGWSYFVFVYELHLPNSWEVDSIPYPHDPQLWDGGDFDGDGLYDLAMQCGSTSPLWVGITIIESPDSFSHPSQEVWRDTVGSPLVTPICAYDIDQDSLPEIVKVQGDLIHLHIYESIGDNLYDIVAQITTAAPSSASSPLAFGDFDLDGQNEFAWGYMNGHCSVWECVGDNSYQEVLLYQLPTGNVIDCFTVPDADGDGKLEFVLKGYNPSTGRIEAFILEATGDNTYAVIASFDLAGGSVYYWGGLSDAGDVDGDGVPEILIEGCQTIYIVKAAGNDSFYVWETLPGHVDGSCVRVFDLDGNGYAEVIVSGHNETRIYEYDPGAVEEIGSEDVQEVSFEIYPNPFQDNLSITYQLLGMSSGQAIGLIIFDACGRTVRQYNQSVIIQGTRINWDGADGSGSNLPGGVYFVRLESDNHSITKKIVKLR